MISISCSVKLWSFHLAEQMEKHGKLDALYTSYASQKNTILRRLVKRIDKEEIPATKIITNPLLAVPIKLNHSNVHKWNNMFDKWVASQLKESKSKVFIGWSGMSLHALRAAKKKGMITILERGSTHIELQNQILKDEYKRFGVDFEVHPQVIEKELHEYEEADYIAVPSLFVKRTFLNKGFPEKKILMNPFGAGKFFRPAQSTADEKKKFTILYLGTLSIRKGLNYFFEALHELSIPEEDYQVWFIGSMEPALKPFADKMAKPNWKFWGHINHYELQQYLTQCDVGIHPSLEEGLSMVIPQMMACGVPVIATPNTGAENVITNEVNGLIIPPQNPAAITEKIMDLYSHPEKLTALKKAAANSISDGFTWDDYGNRYIKILGNLIQEKRS